MRFRLAIAASLLTAITGCSLFANLADLEERSFNLRPVVTGVSHVGRANTDGVCPFLLRTGTSPALLNQWRSAGGLEEQGMLVGFSSWLIRGADPIPCNTWVFQAFQGKALFNFTELPAGSVVQSARLTYTRSAQDLVDGGPASNPCTYSIGTARGLTTSAYERSVDLADYTATRAARPDSALTSGSANVTRTVTRWVNARTADDWFVFSIDDGRALVPHEEEDGLAYCALYLNDVALEITAMVPPDS